ncbi:leishmanolysin family protein, putative [Ichthyophthirius multifiliis]|uniref:Leishmanolysin family protein, putative n=1 Tax=Ichthyophthirius multifiliis TaxID=5932 RepID=G0R6L5_ICHMU|nr:leishmanolysin family protein, putative [Ichthyophthirius multifiliis]EGR26884.1 leishmanolysin family protein, putative [Ichthyophthirius multifiliis]|eukprot:XP_004023768.1 leishmanolysin family protein, putative [Ichthyophthirius multifiliis]
MEEQMFYGQGAGCEHVMGKCDSAKIEFCDPKTDQKLCDFYHHGQSFCHVYTLNDSGCNTLVTYINAKCWDVNSILNTRNAQLEQGVKFGIDSRCFNGNLMVKNKKHSFQNIGNCYRYQCDSTKQQVNIWVGQIKQTCSQNLEKLTFQGYKGFLECPKNLSNFCRFKKICPGFCNANGYCLNNKCYCAKGFIGKDCNIKIVS